MTPIRLILAVALALDPAGSAFAQTISAAARPSPAVLAPAVAPALGEPSLTVGSIDAPFGLELLSRAPRLEHIPVASGHIETPSAIGRAETVAPILQYDAGEQRGRIPTVAGYSRDSPEPLIERAYSELPAESLEDPARAGPALDGFFDLHTGRKAGQPDAVSAGPAGGDASIFAGLEASGTEDASHGGAPPPPGAAGKARDGSRPIGLALAQAAVAAALSILVLSGQMTVWPAVVILSAFLGSAWALDRLVFGGRLRSGESLTEIAVMTKDMTKSMAGVLFLAPVLGAVLGRTLGNVLASLGLDPSVAAPVLAVDMGGYPLAKALALDPLAGLFNGLIVSSMLGATVVFTIPFSFGLLRAEDKPFFVKGLASGLVTIAPGAFVGGLLMGLSAAQMAALLAPVAVLTAGLFAALRWAPIRTIGAAIRFAGWVQKLSYVGLAVGLVAPLLSWAFSWTIGTASVIETFGIIGSIMLVMAAVLPMVGLLQRRLGDKGSSVAGLISSLVVLAPMVGMFSRMGPRGKIINAAFAVSAAWIFADHLAMVLTVEPAYALAVMAAKAAGGLLSLPVAWWVSRTK